MVSRVTDKTHVIDDIVSHYRRFIIVERGRVLHIHRPDNYLNYGEYFCFISLIMIPTTFIHAVFFSMVKIFNLRSMSRVLMNFDNVQPSYRKMLLTVKYKMIASYCIFDQGFHSFNLEHDVVYGT